MGWDNVAYLRISKDRVGAGLGVERQKHDITEQAAREGVTIQHWYVDNDMSAYQRRKPRRDYTQLLADMSAGQVEPGGRVWVWHTDRLHRNNGELEGWIIVAHPADVAVMTVKAGKIDLATPSGRMMARQLGAVAQYQSEHMAEQLRGKMEELARNGEFRGGPRPFGYTADGMELVDLEAKMIKMGVRVILRGGSLTSICRHWTRRGARGTLSGRPFQPSLVKQVLTRPRNAGLVVLRGEVVGKGQWPAIVSEQELQAVTTILSNPARLTHAGTQPRWLGTGIYRCGFCGFPLVVGASSTGTGRGPTYVCSAGRRGQDKGERKPGRHVVRTAQPLDDWMSNVIIERLDDPAMLELLRPHDMVEIDADALKTELSTIESEQLALVGMMKQGWTVEMVSQANTGLSERKREIEDTLAALLADSPAARLAHTPDPAHAWRESSLETKRAILRELVVAVRVLPARPGQRRFLDTCIEIEWAGAATVAQ